MAAVVSGGAGSASGLQLQQPGHWVASPELNSVSFVNGSSKSIDAQVPVPGLEPGSQVVQGDTSGYVIGPSRVIEFGKSNLAVQHTIAVPTGERSIGIETPGGPYLVFREAGEVMRLGSSPQMISAGGALGDPVATPDGTLWLHRTDAGVLCELPKDAAQITCPGLLPSGHSGALTVVGASAAFVDTTSNVIQPVTTDGLGKAERLNVDPSPDARVSPAAADGRVAILEPNSSRMYFVDAADLSGATPARPPVTVDLPQSVYSNPTASESSVVLLDLTHNTVLTYGPDGVQRQATPIPPETGQPELARGEDNRVYVDGGEGKHVLVVDSGGAVSQVPVEGAKPPVAPPVAPPPASPPSGNRVPSPPDIRADGGPAKKPDKPKPPVTPVVPVTTVQKAIPASPPGIAGNVSAQLQGANASVSWSAAADNGAAVSSYRVSWSPSSGAGAGSTSSPGSARSATITGLRAGIRYAITVVAVNSAGSGAPASTSVQRPAAPTRSISLSRGGPTTGKDCPAPDCAWMHVVLHGFAPNTKFDVDPHSSDPNYTNPGSGQRTDANGTVDFEAFYFAQVGNQAWVTADGVKSNVITWQAG